MSFGNLEYFGNSKRWRVLSPLVVLLWVVMIVGFAGTAHADGSGKPAAPVTADQAATGQETATDATTDASDASADTADSADQETTAPTTEAGTSGDVTEPQPISNADANTGGANGQCPDGPYCSTRDGSPSANGSGDGKAVGEPCAGCVGKADNKNPAGQKPDASDANAGYECDTNHGIAQTNPAHTGCLTAPPEECVPTDEVPCVSPPVCVPTDEVPCVSPPVCVPTADEPCVSPPEGGPLPPAVTPPQVLPNTGAPEGAPWLAAAGLASLMAGAGLLFRRRQPTS
jgi:LPXTG-motif cell wall-anchored protein